MSHFKSFRGKLREKDVIRFQFLIPYYGKYNYIALKPLLKIENLHVIHMFSPIKFFFLNNA